MLELTPHSKTSKSVDRPLPLRMRSDLEITSRMVRGSLCFVLKDPVTASHHRLWLEEYQLLRMLDGKTSLSSMKRQFEAHFPQARLDLQRLEVLIGIFYRNGLLLSDRPGQATSLLARYYQQGQASRSQLGNLWCIRLPGINPERLLRLLNHNLGSLFSPTGLAIGFILVVVTWSLMFLQWLLRPEIVPGIESLITTTNLAWLLVAVCALKVVHEFGHGLACLHYGGECKEMGVMLLAFMPTLYCDISDSWTFRSRWERMVVAAAGMWSELLVATVCAWLWWFSQPGLVQSLCFHLMLVGTLSTCLVNANPLLKYDGYFILSDWLDIPNLWMQSRAVWTRLLDRVFFKRDTLPIRAAVEGLPAYLSLYAVGSMFYQSFVVVSLIVVATILLRQANLEFLAFGMVLLAVGGTAGQTARRFSQLTRIPAFWRNMRLFPSVIAASLLIGCAVLFWLPLPYKLNVPVLQQVANGTPIIAVQGGRLDYIISEGTAVRSNDVIAKLAHPDLQLALLKREGELKRQQSQLFALEGKRTDDSGLSSQVAEAQEAVKGLEAEVARLREATEQLTLRAPMDGLVFAASTKFLGDTAATIEAPVHWSGTPLHPQNLGCYIPQGESLCLIGQPTAWEGIAFLQQSEVELLRIDDRVTIRSSLLPAARWTGTIRTISHMPIGSLPREVKVARSTHFEVDAEQGATRYPVYIATVAIDGPQSIDSLGNGGIGLPLHNSVGTAAIQVGPQSLGYRLWRLLDATFTNDILSD